jgi:transcriptional regulator with XRE-family HTH domain
MKSSEMIKRIRLSFCLDQKEFGELIAMSRQAIWQYEKGIRKPRLPTIRKLLMLAKKNHIKTCTEDFME